MIPEMHEIRSSMAAKIGYSDEGSVLYVEMHPTKKSPDVAGPTYRYQGVPRADYDRLRYGESVGKYIHKIKDLIRGERAEVPV